MRYLIGLWSAAVAVLVMSAAPAAHAQGLLWSLPPDGSWVRFEGPQKTTQVRPQSKEGDLEIDSFRMQLTVSSVGKENAEFEGRSTACRWIEFKSQLGREGPNGFEVNAFGTRLYKVLVPEERVLGKMFDAKTIPVLYLPIVKGYRKLGERDVQAVTEKVLLVNPLICAVSHYTNLKPEGDPESVNLPIGDVMTRPHKGTVILENASSRSTNEGLLWLSNDVPFGLAKFTVTITQEAKDSTLPKDQFQKTSTVRVEMAIVAKGTDARSEVMATP